MTGLPGGDDVSSLPDGARYSVSAMSSPAPVAESLGRKPTPEERQAAAEHLRRAEKEAARSRRIPEGVSGAEVANQPGSLVSARWDAESRCPSRRRESR